MKYLQSQKLYELKNLQENRKGFWEDFEYAIRNENVLSVLEYLHERYPKIVNDDTEFSDRLVDLHNHQKVPKRYSFTDWVYMWTIFLTFGWNGGLMKKMQIDNIKQFMFNQKVTIYRGTPVRKKYNPEEKKYLRNIYVDDWEGSPELDSTRYYSFTFDKDIALTFTQRGWAQIVNYFNPMKDKSERNGYLYEIEILPKDIHIVNNKGNEYEALLKGPLSDYKVHIVKEGEIV